MALHCLNDLWLVADKFTIALSKAMKNGHTKSPTCPCWTWTQTNTLGTFLHSCMYLSSLCWKVKNIICLLKKFFGSSNKHKICLKINYIYIYCIPSCHILICIIISCVVWCPCRCFLGPKKRGTCSSRSRYKVLLLQVTFLIFHFNLLKEVIEFTRIRH